MNRYSWDETWYRTAQVVANRSLCSRAQVGAVIVDTRNRIAATGYNGPPDAFDHGGQDCSVWCPRATGSTQSVEYGSSCPSIHAEANALLYVDRTRVEGGTLFVTRVPCWDCAKMIANSGLVRVVTRTPRAEDLHRQPHEVKHYLSAFNHVAVDYYEETE